MINYNTRIVRDGLVLHLDAANPKSYSGGTEWRDLSGNGNNGVNYGGLVYSTENKGYFSFDNTDDVSIIPNSPSLNPITALSIESWAMFAIGSSTDFIFEKGNVNTQYSLFSHGNDIVFRTKHEGDASYQTQNPSKASVGVINGQWHHIVGSWDGTTKRIFIDGILKNSIAKSGNLVTTTPGAAVGRFGGTTTGYYFQGNISKVSVYSKGLSELEVKQNFEATRGRYQ